MKIYLHQKIQPEFQTCLVNFLLILVGCNLANKIKQSNVKYDEINTTESFDLFFKEKIDEIRKIISNLKDDTAAGFDGISVKILNSISENIVNPLPYIYNLSLKEG